MKYQLFLVRKYLTSRIYVPIVGIVFTAKAVFVLFVMLSLMEGFRVEMRDRLRGTLAHMRVEAGYYQGMKHEEETLAVLRRQPHVEAVAPFVEALAIFKSGSLDYCSILGIDPRAEAQVTNFGGILLREENLPELSREEERSVPDDYVPLSPDEVEHLFSLEHARVMARRSREIHGLDTEVPPVPIVVGIQALRNRLVRLGQIVQLSSYTGIDHTPCTQKFLVVGAFMSGLQDHDLRVIYMPIRAAQEFLGLFDPETDDYRLGGVAIRLDDYANAESVRVDFENRVLSQLPDRDVIIRTWEDQRRNLLQAVDIEKSILYNIFMLVVVFAALVICVLLWLLVIEKTRDLGVLASLGAPPSGIIIVFTVMGMVLCVAGGALGLGLGWLFTERINEVHDMIHRLTGWQLFPPDVYYLTEIPIEYTRRDLAIIVIPTLAFGFLGSFIPAFLAARRDPIGALRHE